MMTPMMSVAEQSTMEATSNLRWSFSRQQMQPHDIHRNLGNGNTRISNLGSTEMLLWYCLVAVILVPFAMCALYYIYHNHHSHQRALEAMADEDLDDDVLDIENDASRQTQNLESMEQNIQAFSKLEKQRITRIVRSSVRKHVKHFSPEELRRHCNSKSSATPASEKETVCGICLEDLIPSGGSSSSNKNTVCSSNNPHCRHLYHEDCIVSWLAPRAQWLCPICRQEFIVKKNKNSSSGSSTVAATDRCGSSVCGALSTTADCVSTMTLRSPGSELGDVNFPAVPLSPGVDVSEHNLDDDDGGDDNQPPSSAASTVLGDSSSSSGLDDNDDSSNEAAEQQT